jgi:D-alanine-D-alanine ligase
LIVKPVAEDGSLGIGPEAVVTDRRQLVDRVRHTLDAYRQAALVEEMVQGREFNVSLWGAGPECLPLAEIDFSDFRDPLRRIVSFAAKWDADSFEFQHTPVVCPAGVSADLAERIRAEALAAWRVIGCRGYARVDMRVDLDDTPWVIEVNCNPDLSPDAGFFRACSCAGHAYDEMIERILSFAGEAPG